MQNFINPRSKPSFLSGTTCSQLQCYYLGLDYRDTFRQLCDLGFDRTCFCSYWHELEVVKDQFDFKTLDWLLEESNRHRIKVVLTVGVKAPRYPEFHFPKWLEAYPSLITLGKAKFENLIQLGSRISLAQK